MGLALDVLDHVFSTFWRERPTICTFNETLLFLGWREAKLVRTSGPTKCFDVVRNDYRFSTKHIRIRGGVEDVIHVNLVVPQHGTT